MYKYNLRHVIVMLMALGQGLLYVSTAEARLFFSTEEDGVQTPAFYINQGDTSDDFVDLNFGTTAGAQLRYDVVNDEFLLNRDLDLGANELQDFKIERLAVAPTCDGAAEGRMYFNTASSQTFVCDGTVFNVLENEALATVASSGDYNDLLNLPTLGTAADNAETDFATSAQGALADTALQSGDNVSELVNDAGYLTTDSDTTYSAGTGITLTGTTFSNDLGTSIDATEIDANAVADDEIDYTAVTLNDFTNDAGFITTDTDDQTLSLLGTNLTIVDGNTVDLASIDTDTDTTYTGSGGITLTGTNFTADLGTDIATGEIQDDAITSAKVLDATLTADDLADDAVSDAEIDYTNVTLLDFTNDANYLTSADISDDTNLAAGTGATLTGDTLSVDLGTSIDATEIDTNAVADDEIDYSAVTLLDFTNDANFLTTVDVSDDTNLTAGTGATLTGDEISVDLGTSIDTAEIELNTIVADDIATDAVGADELADDAVDTAAIQNNAVDGSKLALGSDAEGDIMFYNGTDWDRLPVGTANQVLQVNGAADAPVWNDSTTTKYQFLDIFGCVRGSASAGTVAGGNSAVVRFDGGNNSQMRCALPVPSDWQAGTDINIEVYYSPSDTSAGDVSFVLRHAAFGIGETVSNGAFTDTLTGPETITASTELDIYELSGDIPAATLAADDMINFNLRRQPGDAADTYAGDINIHQLRISYTGK